MSVVTPQTRSLLSAAISAADHGYFDDAHLLLRDALDTEFVPEIAQAMTAIERRKPDSSSIDLRPELQSLFMAVDPVVQAPATPTRSVPLADDDFSDDGDFFGSEVVIDFEEIPDGSLGKKIVDYRPTSDSYERIPTNLSQPNIDPAQLERQAASRARYAAAAPAPPPPSHRRSARTPSREHQVLRNDDTSSPTLSVQEPHPVSRLPQRTPPGTVGLSDRPADDFGDFGDDDFDLFGQDAAHQSGTHPQNAPVSLLPEPQSATTPHSATDPVNSSARATLHGMPHDTVSERDTVQVAVPADPGRHRTTSAMPHPATGLAPITQPVAALVPAPPMPSTVDLRQRRSGPTETPSSGSVTVEPTPSSFIPAKQTAESPPAADEAQRPEFQTEERSARFRVAHGRSTAGQTSGDRPHRQLHTGVDEGDRPAARREVLGGNLAPKPVDVAAELKLLGHRILKRNVAAIQAARASLTPRSMFLLDQIDGMSSVEDIVDVTGLPAHEAYTMIRQLVDRGLVYLD